MKISILLATYNGEKYLSQQIDSLLNQTYKDFTIYVSDDNSRDRTISILKEYAMTYPDKIQIINHEIKIGGACKNFLFLLEKVDSDIYFFCDQDDVWDKYKIEKTLKIFENQTDKSIPVLVHSDLRVVDAKLQVISPSYLSMTKKLKYLDWKEYLVENNNVVGCTAAINESLAKLYKNHCSEIDKGKILMHDSFFAQLASLSGKIEYIDESLLNYRQHGDNTVGATKKSKLFISVKHKLKNINTSKELFRRREENIYEVLKCCGNIENQKTFIAREFSNLYKQSKWIKIKFLLKNRIKRKSIFENIYIWLSV